MARLPSFASIGFLCIICFLSNAAHSQSADASDCLITEDSCPCSVLASSASCMRYKGDGQCILGACPDSYKCDCLGYQMCKKSQCSIYIAAKDAVPSDTVLFPCHVTPTDTSCTIFNYILDTVAAAKSARNEALDSNTKLAGLGFEIQEIVTDLSYYAVAVNHALEELDGIRTHMTPKEETKIFSNAYLIRDLLIEGTRAVLQVSVDGEDALKMSVRSTDMAEAAADGEKKVQALQKELKDMAAKAKKDNRTCAECEKLEIEIKSSVEFVKESAVNAGKAAKNSKSKVNNGKRILLEMEERRMKSQDVRDEIFASISKVKERSQMTK